MKYVLSKKKHEFHSFFKYHYHFANDSTDVTVHASFPHSSTEGQRKVGNNLVFIMKFQMNS